MSNIVVFFILLWSFIIPIPAHAQTPTAAPSPIVDPFSINKDPHSLDPVHEEYDMVNSVIHLDKTDTQIAQSSLIGQVFPFLVDFIGYVKPKDDNYHISTEKSVPYAEQVQNASFEDLTPAGQQEITIHDTQPKRYCATGRICATNPQTGENVVNAIAESVWCTQQDVPGVLHGTEGNKRINSFVGRSIQMSQDFTLANVRVKKIVPPGCSERASGDIIDQTEIGSIEENEYAGPGAVAEVIYTVVSETVSTVTRIVDGIKETFTQYKSTFTVPAVNVMGGLLPWAGHNNCLVGGCPNPADLDPIKYADADQKKALQDAGGWVNNMYRNDVFDPTYKVGRDASFQDQEFEVSASNKDAKADTTVFAIVRTQEAQTLGNCNILPAEMQKDYYPKGECEKNWLPTPTTTCSTTLPNFAGGACKLCNTDKIKDLADNPGTVPEGIRKTLQDILSTVGSKFGVPPSNILAVMYHEGAFSRSELVWSDANVKAWSVCGGGVPGCDIAGSSAASCSQSGACNFAIAGFGWRPYYFWSDSDKYWEAVREIDNTRTKEVISPCNVLDAAAATAKALAKGAAFVPPGVPSQCFGLPMTSTSSPGSCTSPPWSDATVLQSHVSYAGYCPEPGNNGQYPELPQYKDWVLNFYNTFKCN